MANKDKETVNVPPSPASSPDAPKPGEDVGQEEVQENFDEAEEKGYFGEGVDKTPNENYTLSGVTSGAKTPESIEHEQAGKPGTDKEAGK